MPLASDLLFLMLNQILPSFPPLCLSLRAHLPVVLRQKAELWQQGTAAALPAYLVLSLTYFPVQKTCQA